MTLNGKKKVVKIITFLLSIIFVSIFLFHYYNFGTLTLTANGFDQPSRLYYLSQKRLLEMVNAQKAEKIAQVLKYDENKFLHRLYLKLLSLNGLPKDNDYLLTVYENYQKREKDGYLWHNIIDTMGTSGNLAYVPFLEKLLDEYGSNDSVLMRFSVGQALFLLTGKEYKYDSDKPLEKTRFAPKGFFRYTDRQFRAREIIYDTINRERTIDEMVELDKILFRPPGW